MPATVGWKPSEVALPALTALADVNAGGPEQFESFGPCTSNVTVPVGSGPPAGAGPSVAVSWNAVPSVIAPGVTRVEIASGAWTVPLSLPVPLPPKLPPCTEANAA